MVPQLANVIPCGFGGQYFYIWDISFWTRVDNVALGAIILAQGITDLKRFISLIIGLYSSHQSITQCALSTTITHTLVWITSEIDILIIHLSLYWSYIHKNQKSWDGGFRERDFMQRDGRERLYFVIFSRYKFCYKAFCKKKHATHLVTWISFIYIISLNDLI